MRCLSETPLNSDFANLRSAITSISVARLLQIFHSERQWNKIQNDRATEKYVIDNFHLRRLAMDKIILLYIQQANQ